MFHALLWPNGWILCNFLLQTISPSLLVFSHKRKNISFVLLTEIASFFWEELLENLFCFTLQILHLLHSNRQMDHFQEIFTPPASPAPDYNPREDILHQIYSMEDGDRRDARAWQFINQIPGEQQDQGAVGGVGQSFEGYPPVNSQQYQPMNPQGPPPVNHQEFQPVNPPVNPVNLLIHWTFRSLMSTIHSIWQTSHRL